MKNKEIVDWMSENYTDLFSHKKGSTRDTYNGNGKKFLKFIKENGFQSSTMNDFIKYIDPLTEFQATRHSWLIAAKVMLHRSNFLNKTLIPSDLFFDNSLYLEKPPINTRKTRDGVSKSEDKDILKYISTIENSDLRIKIYCQYVLLRYQGCRASELIDISVKDIKFKEGYIILKRKGSDIKEPLMMFNTTKDALSSFISNYNLSEGLLFPGYSRQKIRKEWKTIFDACKIKDRTINDFRHLLASWAVEISNGNAFFVQSVMRHKSTKVVQYYIDEWIKKKNFEDVNRGFDHFYSQ